MIGPLIYLVILACMGALFIKMPRVGLAWGIGCLVTLGLLCLLERTQSRREGRPFHIRSGQLMMMPILWPLLLVHCVLMFYGMWAQPRWDARYERQRRARIDRMIASDAARTDRRCASCGKPVPSYRRTCKHCRQPIAAQGEGAPAAAPPR